MHRGDAPGRVTTQATMTLNRREFLRVGGWGAAAMLAGGVALNSGGCPLQTPTPQGDPTGGSEPPIGSSGVALDLELRATRAEAAVLPGARTRVATYQPTVLAGDPARVTTLPGSYLGPIIRARKGERIRVRLANDLSEPTIIHWHGMHVPADMDAHPRFAIAPGQRYVYEFSILDRAGTYWFHPHPHGRTGPQVYQGLAGLLLVSDDEELATALPEGDHDVPLVLQDRVFGASNQLVYDAGGTMMMPSDGFLGDQILVNGQPSFVLSVTTGAYRLRLLNGSNSRVYKLGWSDGTALTVIGTDGGLLETPAQREYVMLAPGERIELWADFSKYSVGAEVTLQSLPYSGAEFGMAGMAGMGGIGGMGGMGAGLGGAVLPNGANFLVLRVRVERQEAETRILPQRLSTIARYRAEDAVNAASPRTFAASFGGMMRWLLNGRAFEMEAVADTETVRLGTLEMWELVNEPGAMEMMHPLHIHGVQFQIVERDVASDRTPGWETVRHGYVDDGWKDTVLLMPGERVKLLLKFADYAGIYLYHCHNLEHEDQGMMRNYMVQA